jgi:hypothetical protein
MKLSPEQMRLLRLRSQRLHPEAAHSISGVAQLVKDLCGIQAQELPSATLAVRPRSTGLLAEDVRRAREEERSIVMTWCMRGTRQLIATDDLSWLLPLFAPVIIRGMKRRYSELGLSQEIRTQAMKEVRRVLGKRGPLSRRELAQALGEGIPVEGQAIAHLVGYAALQGIICFGPERNGELTYVLIEDWVRLSETLEPERALASLARRYLEAYAPATPADLASWSGLPVSQARAAFEAISSDLLEITDPPTWMLKEHTAWLDEPPGEAIVRLLPRYDVYLLGYRSRDFMVPRMYAKRIHPGGGQIHSTLIVDGSAIGVWSSEHKKNGITIVVEPFKEIPAQWLPALQAEAQAVARFLGRETSLRVERPGSQA